MSRLIPLLFLLMAASPTRGDEPPAVERIPGQTPRSVVFILVDDHRFDAMGFMGHPFLETPHLDRLARDGINFTSAYVTTALCSPSRASILTGQYAHNHRVVDNNNPIPEDTITFPELLQRAGYDTAFFGKWHMGGGDASPRPGFDRWVSFPGQGTYLPSRAGLNIDGRKVPQQGYITDEITEYCTDWLAQRPADKPFFACLSHKAVHANFTPAERHRGRYKDAPAIPPPTQAATPENLQGKPRWVRDQRNSWHGVDFPYHSDLDIANYYRNYCETLLAVDDSVGRVIETLEQQGRLDDTLIIYMGDNGFCFGEHGLIDKRTAYEASMRVPFIAHCPALFKGGQSIDRVIANIDVGPTILEAAAIATPGQMDGRSFLKLAQNGGKGDWRDALLYEYYWERNFPHTPTIHALRTQRYKYIHYFGIWDTDELYDMQNDPLERHNLIDDPQHADTVRQLNRQMFDMLEQTGGMYIPLYRDKGRSQNLRLKSRGQAHDFPEQFYVDEPVNRNAQ